MRLSHSPAEPTADGADTGDEGIASGSSSSTTRPRRITTTAAAPRGTVERAYRVLAQRSTPTPDTPDAQRTNAERGSSPPLGEALTASRHADVQQPSTSPTAGTAATATATATAAAAAASLAPVRGRSGSTTQYRVYQPSSLFGTHATPSSLSSSLVGQETPTMTAAAAAAAPTRRPVLARLNDRGGASPAPNSGVAATPRENEASDDTDASARTPSRPSTQTPADVTDTQGAALSSKGAAAGVNANTAAPPPQSPLPFLSSGSSISSSTAARDGGDTVDASPIAVPMTSPHHVQEDVRHAQQSIPHSSRLPENERRSEAAAAAEELEMMSAVELRTSTTRGSEPVMMRLAKYAADPTSVSPAIQSDGVGGGNTSGSGTADAARRCSAAGERSASRLASAASHDAQTQAPADGEDDDDETALVPFTMSSLVAHVAVPAAVQAVLKNPVATKAELWAALKAACQQCALLQRRLARLNGQLTEEDEEKEAAAAAAAGSGISSIPSTSRRDVASEGSVREGVSNGAPATRSPPRRSSGTLPQPAKRVSSVTGRADSSSSINDANGPPASAFAQPAGDVARRVRERVASITTSTASPAGSTAPRASLSTSGLLRGGTRSSASSAAVAGPPQPQQQQMALPAPGADVASALRNRVAEEIRRVEATRRLSGTAAPGGAPPASAAGGRTEGGAAHTSAYARRRQSSGPVGAVVELQETRAAHPPAQLQQLVSGGGGISSSSFSGGAACIKENSLGANITVKVPDESTLGRRKVREAVVKSRDADHGPSLTSPPPLSRESRVSSHGTAVDDFGNHNNNNEAYKAELDEGSEEDDVQLGRRSGSVVSTGSNNNANAGGAVTAAVLRRHASTTSDTASVRSGNNLTLPSIPSASQDNLRKLSFMSRSHNSGRLVPPPRPPSSSASESVAASGGSPAPTATYHRRVRNASVASGDSISICRDGSVSFASGGNELHAAAAAAAAAAHTTPVPPISSKALTASTTLPCIARDDMARGPLSARVSCQLNEDVVEGLALRHGTRGGAQRSNIGATTQQQQQQQAQPLSSWVGRTGSLTSPLNPPLPALNTANASSPLQRSLLLPSSSSREQDGGTATTATRAANAAPGAHAHTNNSSVKASSAAPSLLDMVRQVAEEETPVSPASDVKKAELREWRRQAAKAGLHGAPSAF